MLRGSLIRAIGLCCMVLGLTYVSGDGALVVEDCSELDFWTCMEGWECEETQDCEDLIGATGAPCVVAEAKCRWHLSCLGQNPRLDCSYDEEPH